MMTNRTKYACQRDQHTRLCCHVCKKVLKPDSYVQQGQAGIVVWAETRHGRHMLVFPAGQRAWKYAYGVVTGLCFLRVPRRPISRLRSCTVAASPDSAALRMPSSSAMASSTSSCRVSRLQRKLPAAEIAQHLVGKSLFSYWLH